LENEKEGQDDIFNSYAKQIVEPGEGFGDFSQINEVKYSPCYAIVDSNKAKILQLDRKNVDNLV